ARTTDRGSGSSSLNRNEGTCARPVDEFLISSHVPTHSRRRERGSPEGSPARVTGSSELLDHPLRLVGQDGACLAAGALGEEREALQRDQRVSGLAALEMPFGRGELDRQDQALRPAQ